MTLTFDPRRGSNCDVEGGGGGTKRLMFHMKLIVTWGDF